MVWSSHPVGGTCREFHHPFASDCQVCRANWGGRLFLAAMTKMMNLVRVKSVAVFSVLSLVAAFLVSGVVSPPAQAAPKELTTFELAATGSVVEIGFSPYNVLGGSFTAGSGTLQLAGSSASWTSAKATATTLTFTMFSANFTLAGSNWAGYSGQQTVEGRTLVFTGLAIKNPPKVSNKPRVPRSVAVTGSPSAKSFKVSWKKPSVKGYRPISGYRVQVNQVGKKKLLINKELGKKARSYKVKRSVLRKSLRSAQRGEVSLVRFRVRVFALGAGGISAPSTKWIRMSL